MWRKTVVLVALTGSLLGIAHVPVGARRPLESAPPAGADQFFNETVVADIHLTMSTRDWATLKENYLANTYYPCTFEWGGMVVGNATVRSRGSGTRNPQKPGLRVDFNRYDSSQRFLGLKYIVLDNGWQDPSMIKERLTMLLLGRMGIPAPRETHMRLFVNGEHAGLYIAVEAPDDVFVERTLGSTDGYLYEYNWEREYHFEYLGGDLAAYRFFDPKTRSKDPAALVWGPIEAMIRTMNLTPDAIFVREMSAYIDLQLFARQIALENFVADSDGLLGDWGLDNFYLYRDASGTRFQILEWDKDNAFHTAEQSIMKGVAENVLARRTLSERPYLDVYLQTLLDAATLVEPRGGATHDEEGDASAGSGLKGEGRPRQRGAAGQAGWLEREILREYRQIRDFARADHLKPVTNEEFESEVQGLLRFAEARPAFVRAAVARMRATK